MKKQKTEKTEKRKEIRKTNNKKKKRRENKNLFIQINRLTDKLNRQTDKLFDNMRYNTEYYNKSNSIK